MPFAPTHLTREGERCCLDEAFVARPFVKAGENTDMKIPGRVREACSKRIRFFWTAYSLRANEVGLFRRKVVTRSWRGTPSSLVAPLHKWSKCVWRWPSRLGRSRSQRFAYYTLGFRHAVVFKQKVVVDQNGHTIGDRRYAADPILATPAVVKIDISIPGPSD